MQELEQGDVVVHPQHGPVAVCGFADRLVGGHATRYVELETFGHPLRIKAPVARLDALGVRSLMTRDELGTIRTLLAEDVEPVEESRWAPRLRAAEDLLHTGRLEDAAVVARDLWRRDRERGISYVERQVRDRAAHRIAMEVSAVLGSTPEEALALVEAAIFDAER